MPSFEYGSSAQTRARVMGAPDREFSSSRAVGAVDPAVHTMRVPQAHPVCSLAVGSPPTCAAAPGTGPPAHNAPTTAGAWMPWIACPGCAAEAGRASVEEAPSAEAWADGDCLAGSVHSAQHSVHASQASQGGLTCRLSRAQGCTPCLHAKFKGKHRAAPLACT